MSLITEAISDGTGGPSKQTPNQKFLGTHRRASLHRSSRKLLAAKEPLKDCLQSKIAKLNLQTPSACFDAGRKCRLLMVWSKTTKLLILGQARVRVKRLLPPCIILTLYLSQKDSAELCWSRGRYLLVYSLYLMKILSNNSNHTVQIRVGRLESGEIGEKTEKTRSHVYSPLFFVLLICSSSAEM